MTSVIVSRKDRDSWERNGRFDNRPWEPEGTANWRDVGGLSTTSGHVVRHGRLFRSDTLQDLTDDDVDMIVHRLGVRTVVDLRVREEAEAEGHGPLGARGVCRYNLPFAGSWDHDPGVPLPGEADRCVVGYSLSLLERSPVAITTAVTLLSVPRAMPAVIHCAAGKDRTGVLIAIILSLVGVPEAEIVREYAKSSQRIPAVLRRLSAMPTYAAHPAGLRPEVNRTQPESMSAFLALVRDRYGSVEAYLREHGMASDVPEAFRELLLTARGVSQPA